MKKALLFLGTLFCLQGFAQDFKIVKTYYIPSTGGWDYIAVNNGKLYVSHSTQVNILDAATGDSVGVVAHTAGVHGIAFDNALNHGYTTNGRSNNVTVFDLKTNGSITEITTGEGPDAILFEPYTKSIITCNGHSKNLSVINPATNTVVQTIDIGGRPEEAASDGAGRLFVNLEDKNEIAVVDLKTYSVVHRWSLAPGTGPTGLAYDAKTRRLFSGCEKQLIVLDAVKGSVIDKIKIGDGCDGVAFDPKHNLVFTSNGEGTLSVIKESSPNTFTLLKNVSTRRGARTIAFDEKTGTIYLPTANFEGPAKEGERPRMIPGSFQVLVLRAGK